MSRMSLDKIEEFLDMIAYSCPEEVYKRLAKFQPSCHDVVNCYDCWCRTLYRYQTEQSLKIMKNEEDN